MTPDEPRAAAARSNSFLTELIQERINAFKTHCLSHPSDGARAWLFTDGPPSPTVQGHLLFDHAESPVRLHLLDLYHGRTPTLISSHTLSVDPNVQIALRLFVILDSNALSYVSRFLDGRLSGPINDVVHDFLRFILEHGLDPSPVFYLMESIARAEPSRWRESARAFAAAIAGLQTLDRELFLTQGRLASSIQARRNHHSVHRVADAGELIDKYTSSLSPGVVAGEEVQITRTYAALLKAMLLRTDGPDLSTRLEELGTFMTERLGAVLGIERFAAILHWAAPERFARLLTPIQLGASAERALEKARSTAWDIYLGRLPEQLGKFVPLVETNDAEATCNLYYLATGDDALATLLSHRSIELLIQHIDSTESSIVVGHQAGVLEGLLSPDQMTDLSDRSLEWEKRAKSTADLRSPVGRGELEEIVSELERAVVLACKTRKAR